MESYIHLYETNDEFTAAYNGPDYVEPWLSLTVNTMTIGYNKPKLTAITFNSITWVTDIPATGGTATKDNCTFKVYANYDNGSFLDISSDATVTGELIVAETTATTRQSAGQLTLTASYGDFTATGNVTVYQEAAAPDFSTEPLTFNILSDGTVNWTASDSSLTKTIEYKLNDSGWASITSNTGESVPTIEVNSGDKLQFRGNNAAYCGDNPELYSTFGGSTAEFEIEGNIMSLINSTDFSTLTTLESNFTFAFLFSDCTGLTSAENLILPATTLAEGCYFQMFQGCTSLTTAPELPANTLAMGCYFQMFQGCTSLTTAPELPATELASVCYQYMFQGCTSLKTAPALPAMTLAEACYSGMFYGCTKLTSAPELPATELADRCYQYMFQDCTSLKTAPALPATTLADSCYDGMFYGCTSLKTAPELPATKLAYACYNSMFQGCTSLTTAPELPATILANGCYAGMFIGCTSLNYIKCLATDISASNCTSNWVDGVAATGTFVKSPDMSGWIESIDGVPTGWTVEDNQEPLTFNILSAGTINWTASNTDIAKTIDYKLNDNEWASITSNTGSSAPSIEVNSGDKIQFRGNNTQYGIDDENYNSFSGSTAWFELEGNIMSLIYGDDFENKLTISSTYTFTGLFRNCTKLISAKNLILPATSLTNYCYGSMFIGCTSLKTAPELPATTLARRCYYRMFSDCTSLTTAPELPAETLADSCYDGMFYGCTSLKTAPELPATTLANYCYSNMFQDCTSLKTAPELPAMTLADRCYSNMFQDCTSLKTAPELPATKLVQYCYFSMFQGCKSLTTAPALPATTLVEGCYSGMFYGCTKLNYIKCLAKDISATDCTSYWVDSVSSTGTFVKPSSMTSWGTGSNGIPTGWTVEEYIDYNKKPLTFKITSGGTIYWSTSNRSVSKTIDYKLNDGEWKSITSNTWASASKINVNAGDKVQFKGNNTAYGAYSSHGALYNTFYGSTARFEIEGNIMSLINSENFATLITLESDYTFSYLFDTCTGLTSAENLILPATTLTSECYQYMFQCCRSLTTAPKLPAKTLGYLCYDGMFRGCSKLTSAPALPATKLAGSCYQNMFDGCTSLTTAPALPATTLADYCYGSMFSDCTSLTTAPELPATKLAYACYNSMFQGCRSLTTAPELPATKLANYCYQYMFEGCRSLNYIKCLATDISATECTERWVSGVASTGTFVKNPSVRWFTGTSSIPSGWTVQNA